MSRTHIVLIFVATAGLIFADRAEAQVPANDEFNNAATLSNWSNRSVVEGTANQWTALDINTTTPGSLVIIPTTSAWYTTNVAPYLYQSVTGNFVASAKVNARSTGSAGAAPASIFNSAGILARNPASAGVPASQNWIQYDIGMQQTFVGFEAENTVNSVQQNAVRTASPNGVFAAVLRLCRVGNTFYTYNSVDGEQTWTQGQSFVRSDLPATLQIGPATNAYGQPASLRAEFDFIRFAVPSTQADCTAPMPAPGGPDVPPTVTLTSPAGNMTLVAGTGMTLSASAADSDGTVTSVSFVSSGATLGTATSSPFNFTWVPSTPGTYAISAMATDNAGLTATSPSVTVTVTDAPPTVSLTAPASNVTVLAGASVTISASAADSDGTVTSVAFYQGGTLLQTLTAPPYTIQWSSSVLGTYAIDAVATDNAGLTATSQSVTITVSSAPPPPPPPSPCTATNDQSVLSDSFTDGSLNACWNVWNPTAAVITEPAHQLNVHQTVGNLWWWTTYTGNFEYKNVTGNFKVSTAVHMRPYFNPPHPGTQSLAGIMAANPNGLATGSSTNNFVFVHVGWEGTRDTVEAKTTVNSVSTWYNPTYPATEAELRICRVGAIFNTYYRAIGATTWTLFESFTRTDLPSTLIVGMEQSALPNPPDFSATYDYITFGNVSSAADCTTDP